MNSGLRQGPWPWRAPPLLITSSRALGSLWEAALLPGEGGSGGRGSPSPCQGPRDVPLPAAQSHRCCGGGRWAPGLARSPPTPYCCFCPRAPCLCPLQPLRGPRPAQSSPPLPHSGPGGTPGHERWPFPPSQCPAPPAFPPFSKAQPPCPPPASSSPWALPPAPCPL